MSKFLCLFRFPTSAWPAKPSSPEEMQKAYAAWQAWMKKFEKELLPGDGLKTGGALVKGGGTVSDGPYIEAKEVIASYSMLETTSLARAIEIIKECPIGAGDSVEIRELAGYSM
ncbi:MAG TPA: YciI family protein [Steroidobacteraceae bacterium]|nr:YciI family protein [Steroidobacteraceae bacterium]